jgi:hypothetical protein
MIYQYIIFPSSHGPWYPDTRKLFYGTKENLTEYQIEIFRIYGDYRTS